MIVLVVLAGPGRPVDHILVVAAPSTVEPAIDNRFPATFVSGNNTVDLPVLADEPFVVASLGEIRNLDPGWYVN